MSEKESQKRFERDERIMKMNDSIIELAKMILSNHADFGSHNGALLSVKRFDDVAVSLQKLFTRNVKDGLKKLIEKMRKEGEMEPYLDDFEQGCRQGYDSSADMVEDFLKELEGEK